MKKLILILASSSLLFCTKKKEEIKPQTTTSTQKQSTPSTPTVSDCNKDSTYTRTTPTLPGSLYTFYETCTHVTITWKLAGVTLKIAKPIGDYGISNYKDNAAYYGDSNPKKVFYSIHNGSLGGKKLIVYDIKEAGRNGVGGVGMKY